VVDCYCGSGEIAVKKILQVLLCYLSLPQESNPLVTGKLASWTFVVLLHIMCVTSVRQRLDEVRDPRLGVVKVISCMGVRVCLSELQSAVGH
jgi:hypothetical protein